MAFHYQSQIWSVAGEVKFDEQFTLLNPTFFVQSLTIQGEAVYLHLNIKENGGVFSHQYNIQYMNSTGIEDLDTLVSTAILAVFPDAVAS